jgi:hypothetical protein
MVIGSDMIARLHHELDAKRFDQDTSSTARASALAFIVVRRKSVNQCDLSRKIRMSLICRTGMGIIERVNVSAFGTRPRDESAAALIVDLQSRYGLPVYGENKISEEGSTSDQLQERRIMPRKAVDEKKKT